MDNNAVIVSGSSGFIGKNFLKTYNYSFKLVSSNDQEDLNKIISYFKNWITENINNKCDIFQLSLISVYGDGVCGGGEM